ncbi:MFS general substrate transporter [Pyrrhoderma noxium]|uniref:MFS general substrate transporter n=1 Tax=Pyrrhoderma noxium TaxID=2282107 RepID=A0A286ULI6_9AGAM|nr:MFS general substrate transporter [Pyrrhoderma noxium]
MSSLMDGVNEKNDDSLSTVERDPSLNDKFSEEYRRMARRILWKLDIHILPPLALLWLANFIDRTNIGNARIAGLQRDTHLVGNQFNTALAVFYASYIVSELPSNWILKRMKPNRWLPFIVGAWGVVTTLSGLVQNFRGLVVIRIMLGFCEGGLLPGIILYLSTIYKRHELQLRVGVFYASASLSGAFGGLLATAIIKIDGIGGLAGWRWIFILEGIVTVLFGLIATLVLPSDIASAKFLTEEERDFALARFRYGNVTSRVPLSEAAQRIQPEKADSEHTERVRAHQRPSQETVNQEDEQFEWREVIRGCTDVQTWLTGFAYLGLIVSLYSYSLFLPTIITGLGYSGGEAQLRTVPPYVPAVILTVVVAFLADRLKWRGPFILICLPMAIAGYILAIKAETNNGRYAAVFLMAAGVYPSGPCILSILPNNSSGHYKKATTTALQLMIANTGGFVATFAYTADQAPRYIRGHSISLAFVCLAWVLVAANVAYCMWENKARAEGRRQGNVEKYQELWDTGKTRAPIGDRSPDFRYTL